MEKDAFTGQLSRVAGIRTGLLVFGEYGENHPIHAGLATFLAFSLLSE